MVVLSPAFTALTALLALVGSSGVEAAYPLGHSSRLGKEPRKYLQPQGAAPARPFKPARPVWNRNSDVAGTGEQRFAARNKYRAHRANHQKRSDIDNSSNCKRDDTTGPSSIPGYVLVSREEHEALARGRPQGDESSQENLGNIILHTVYNTTLTDQNTTTKHHKDNKADQGLQLLESTALNYTLEASKDERSLLYIVPADSSQQKQLGEIIGTASSKNTSASHASMVSDIVLDSVTVNLIIPLLNASATGQNWCATFSTVPPAPLHLEPCTYAPGYAGETSSQRFQYSPKTGSLLPLFVQEQAGVVATGSWGPSSHKGQGKSDGGRQMTQEVNGHKANSGSANATSIEALAKQASSFAVSNSGFLNLTFVAAASQPPLPIEGCSGGSAATSSSAAPVPVSTTFSSGSLSRSQSRDRGVPTGTSASSASTTYKWHHHHHSESLVSSSIGSLKPTRHSHYSAPSSTPTSSVFVSEGTTVKHHRHTSSDAVAPVSSSSISHHHHHHDTPSSSGSSASAAPSSASHHHHEASSGSAPAESSGRVNSSAESSAHSSSPSGSTASAAPSSVSHHHHKASSGSAPAESSGRGSSSAENSAWQASAPVSSASVVPSSIASASGWESVSSWVPVSSAVPSGKSWSSTAGQSSSSGSSAKGSVSDAAPSSAASSAPVTSSASESHKSAGSAASSDSAESSSAPSQVSSAASASASSHGDRASSAGPKSSSEAVSTNADPSSSHPALSSSRVESSVHASQSPATSSAGPSSSVDASAGTSTSTSSPSASTSSPSAAVSSSATTPGKSASSVVPSSTGQSAGAPSSTLYAVPM